MIKQKLFAGLALCALALGAHAASPDDTQVRVVSKDWSTKNYNIRDLNKIVFHDSELSIIFRNNQQSKAAYSDLKKLMFVVQPSGVEDVTTKRLSMKYMGGAIYVDGWTEGVANVALYDVMGRMHGMIKAWNGEPIDVCHLSQGVYILKIKGYSMKFIVK